MASTAADIIASAKADAEAARQSALASLSTMGTDLTNAYTAQQAATSAGYQNTLNQLQQAYQTNAKSAYGNYMQEKQNLNNQLTRMGLANTGYGVTQSLLAGSAYSKNLAGLQTALGTNQTNLGIQEQQALADLYSNYAKNKLSLDQYLYEAGQTAYDTAYKNRYQAEQDAISNALQQQYYNYLYSTSNSGGGGSYTDPNLSEQPINEEDWFTKNLGSYDNARKLGREKVATILEQGLDGGYITQAQAEEIIRRIGYSTSGGGSGSSGYLGKQGGR